MKKHSLRLLSLAVLSNAPAAAAQSSGLKPDQVIEWERSRAQMTLAQKAQGAGVMVSTK